MNKKHLTILTLLSLIILSACGPAPEPTLTAEEIANTAIAGAWIAITQTQAAIPTATATPIPTATFTPLPTLTLAPLPSLVPPTIAPTAGEDPCNLPPPSEPKGTLVKVKFVNKSDGNAILSFGMIQPNSLGECGTYGYTLGRYDQPVVTVLAGCYWAFAWIDKPDTNQTSTAKNVNALCITDPVQEPDIWISAEVINFH